MHHATKKSLVAKYSEMKAGGATEEELRTALDNEEKIESKEDADEIIAALSEGSNNDNSGEGDNSSDKGANVSDTNAGDINGGEAPKGTYEVAQEFRDIADFSLVHKVGDDVSDMDPKRLQELVESGLVTKK